MGRGKARLCMLPSSLCRVRRGWSASGAQRLELWAEWRPQEVRDGIWVLFMRG